MRLAVLPIELNKFLPKEEIIKSKQIVENQSSLFREILGQFLGYEPLQDVLYLELQ